MFGKTHGFRSIGMAVTAALWGIAPFAAQAIEPPPPPNDVLFTTSAVAGCAPGGVGGPFTIAAEPRAETVKAAPYSGVGTTEVVTTLADGNRIVRTNTMKYYRDGRGRTRTEYSLAAIGPFTPEQAQTVVTITDPVEGKRYVLHSALKRADIFKMTEGMISGSFGTTRGGVGFVTRGYSATQIGGASVSPDAPSTAAVPSAGSAPRLSAGGSNLRAPVTVTNPAAATAPSLRARAVAPGSAGPMVTAPGGGPAAIAPPVVVMSTAAAALPPANAGFIMQYQSSVSFSSEGCKPNMKPLPSPTSMGERIIEGLKVTGTRNEFTIAAGAVGNEQPIVVSSEQWFSPELGVVVASTHRDPMMGDTSYKLEQISRAEPDPTLFTVPADYTQTEMPAGGFFFESAGPPPPGAPAGAGVRIRGEGPKPEK